MSSFYLKFARYSILNKWFAIFILSLFLFSLNAQPFINKGIESFGEMSKNGLPPGWDYQSSTPNPHGVIVVLEANPRINEIPIKNGDYIGAFYEDDNGELKCGGADFWNGSENIIFAVFGDNNDTPEKDGFSNHETMHFKIYYQDNQKEYDVSTIAWDPSFYGRDTWSSLGVSSATDVLCSVEFDAYATVSENPICIGSTIDLAANIFIGTTGNYTYQWTSVPAGLISNSITTSHTPTESTVYTLEVSDGSNTSIHNLPVTVYENPQVFPGNNITTCVNQSAQLAGQANYYSDLTWTTAGDGTFENPQSLDAIYHPGIQDQGNGIVDLTLSALPINPCLGVASGQTSLIFQSLATITAPGSLEFCELQEMIVEAEAELYSSVFWTTSGDGTFENQETLLVQYFPGSSDLDINEFILTVNANSLSPCQVTVSEDISVSTYNPPTISAPSVRTVCETNTVNVNSIAFNYTNSLWATEGDGSFEDPESLSTSYYPGASDQMNGGAVLTIYAYGTGICQEYAVSKDVQLILVKTPYADAGENLPVCFGGTIQPLGVANNASYVSWSANGDGFFDNIYSLTPIYHPGDGDFLAGSFVLYLTANANYPCTLPDVDSMEVVVLPNPEVETGTNSASICIGDNYFFAQSSAANYSSLAWFTINGSGTFDDSTLLNPTYFPDPENDYPLGSVIIGVVAQALEPCTTQVDDFMTLDINPLPEIDAGEDATAIEGVPFIPQVMAENYASVNWSSSGDGSFSSNSFLNPEYYPGISDLQNNFVTLKVVAEPIGTCTIADADSLNLTILNSQNIVLPQGDQSFSSYINLEEKSFEEIIAPIADKISFAQNFLQVYWPEYDINTFGGFADSPACKVIMSDSASLKLTGYRESNKTISLSKGWNILPVLSHCNVDTQHFADQLNPSLIIITEMEGGKIFNPAGGSSSTLDELISGKCYLIKVSGSINFSFPDCSN